jgi:glycosyltransferase involved in cell wall biosynthesis
MEKKHLKILVISQYFWPENFRVNDLVKFLSKKKHKVDILSGIPNYPNGKIFKEFQQSRKKFSIYEGCKVHRVKHTLRNKGTTLDLFFNFVTFFLSAFYYSLKNLSNKEYDYIIVFGTSPITTAIIGIILSSFTNSKVVLWVLDLWPEVLTDLNLLKNNFLKYSLSIIVKFIYKNSDVVLCQSEAFVKKIKTKSKKIIFYTWPEEIKYKKIKKDRFSETLNIVFAGNIGQAQNLHTVIKAARSLKNADVNWHFVGGGRFKENIVKYTKEFNLDKVKFYDHQRLDKMRNFFDIADVLLLSLIKGEATSNTIPGKFQTYLIFKKPILCHADGIVKKYVKQFQLGLCSNPNNSKQLVNNINRLLEAKKRKKLKKFINVKNTNYLLSKFSKKNILNKFNQELNNNRPIKELRLISKLTINKYNDKNFILSALNLAFLGSLIEKRFSLSKNLICWPDGIMTKLIFDKNINKIPGREIIQKVKFRKNEKAIQIVGNLSIKNRYYLQKRFPGKKIININLPYDTDENLKRLLKDKVKDGIIFLTLPTPKQENIAMYLSSILKNYKIYCIGGAINMLSGEEAPVPKMLEENFEFLWRLRFDTRRRLKRLILNSSYLLYGIIFNKYKMHIKKI